MPLNFVSIQVVIDWWSIYEVHRHYINVIGRIFPIRAIQSNIYGMAGGDGDFQVQRGSGSRLIMTNTVWRQAIQAAVLRETMYINIYNI